MKVLFAVNDENVSASIVQKYQKQYKEIISYKNVYYFNAILKELQMNKSYDRIVISEDLEEFTSSSRTQKDKFIFDRLDKISDEAVSNDGSDIPIILICSERRNKSEEILTKFFGIGVYNAIIGDDRSTDEVCRLINKPRTKKEAKNYYSIDTDDVIYEKENENNVSEMEMQNILIHFKKIGRDEDRYVDSFNNIVSQYNDNQLKVIIAVLPQNVKEVLARKSTEFQRLAGVTNNSYYNNKLSKKSVTSRKESSGTSEKLLNNGSKAVLSKPVVVPVTMDKSIYKKVESKKIIDDDVYDEDLDEEYDDIPTIDDIEKGSLDNVSTVEEIPKKRGRGRPRKNEIVSAEENIELDTQKKRGRGRPRKNPIVNEKIEKDIEENLTLPGFEEDEFEEVKQESLNSVTEGFLPGFEENEEINESDEFEYSLDNKNNYVSNNYERYESNTYNQEVYDNIFDKAQFANLLSAEKKVVAFVGTSKNGTSFIVNNVAQILSNMGVDTAILDATQNKNAYYIYTKNDESLRRVAANSLENLKNGYAEGIKVGNHLTVYTNIPTQNEEMNNSRPILETILKNHTLVLIDCDFDTPIQYFEQSQELYLVQSMDVLTIQPLTAFLRNLKTQNVLDESKIKIVLNKLLRIRGVSGKNIVGGMSNYNDPEMSFMVELFNRNTVKVSAQIPFDEDVYAKYLENLIECEIKINGYPKEFKQKLNLLAEDIYPLMSRQNSNKKNRKEINNNRQYTSSFSTGMNNTLENMRKRY